MFSMAYGCPTLPVVKVGLVSIRSIRENPCPMVNSRQEIRRRIHEILYLDTG